MELQPIDFAKVAQACGARGYTIEDPREVQGVLREALSQPGPVVVEAVVDANEPPMPGKVTTQQAYKFAKSLLRGRKDAVKILETIAEDRLREVI